MQSRLSIAGAIASALLAAACGGTSPATAAASPSPNPSPSTAATGTTTAVAPSKLGQILVDGKGMTVYLFVVDTSTTSNCYTSCATIWPPVLTTGAAQAGAGANASLLGTTTRTDGKTEVTYAGHPLYYFVQDKAAGDITGQGINGFGGLRSLPAPFSATIHQ